MFHSKPLLFFLLLLLTTFLTFVICGAFGSEADIRPWDTDIWGKVLDNEWDTKSQILFRIRFPRLAFAVLVGGCLSLAGLVFQDLFHNPLADPFIIGVSGGCALAGVIAQILGVHDTTQTALIAFAGGFLSLVVLKYLTNTEHAAEKGTMILAGVVMNAFFSAIISMILVISGSDMPKIFQWLMGSLNLPDTRLLIPMSIIVIVTAIALWFLSHPLDLLSLGDFQAFHLGLEVDRWRWIILVCASVLTAVAVSISGMIGFIGMFVPHSIRFICGHRHKITIPGSFLGGAIVLMLADTLVKVLPAGTELPVGSVTALFGGPFFLALLINLNRK